MQAPDAFEHDAFISYRRADESAAWAMYRLLTAFDQRVFLDKLSIPPGASWERAMMSAARRSSRMLVLWSRNAANSDWVGREWAASGGPLVPLPLDRSPLPPSLSAYNAIEGMSGADLILARATELATQKMAPDEVTRTILQELEDDGVRLTPEQGRAVAGFVEELRRPRLWIVTLFWWLTSWLQRYRPKALSVVFGAGMLAGVGGTFTLLVSDPEPVVASACPEPKCETLASAQGLAPHPTTLRPQNDASPGAVPTDTGDVDEPVEPDVPTPEAETAPVRRPLEIAPLQFGKIAIAPGASATREFSVRNPNAFSVRITQTEVRPGAGAGLVPVTLDTQQCARLGPQQPCNMQITLGPADVLFPKTAPVSATLVVNHKAVPLTAELVPPAGTLQARPNQMRFDLAREEPLTRSLLLANLGKGAVELGQPVDSRYLSVTLDGRCPKRLTPGQRCKAQVQVSAKRLMQAMKAQQALEMKQTSSSAKAQTRFSQVFSPNGVGPSEKLSTKPQILRDTLRLPYLGGSEEAVTVEVTINLEPPPRPNTPVPGIGHDLAGTSDPAVASPTEVPLL